MFSGRADRHELTTEEVIRLITDYKNVADGKTITLSGGEPTTRSDFKTMVKAAKALGLQVSVLSNGTLFTEDDANELSQYIDSLQISLDGYSEESNSKVRGKGNFGKAIKTIEYFVTHGVRTSVSITPQPLCLRQHTADFARFAKELTDRYKDYDFEVRFADELLKGRNIDPTDDEKKEYFNLINGILKEIYGPDYDVMYFVRNLYFGAIIDNCMFGIFAIAANGDVYFCTRVGDQSPIANVRDVSMAEISRMSHAAEKASRITNLTPCKNCELRYICGGGCRIDNFPTLVKNTNFENINYAQISRTPCSTDTKNHFYDLMIRSNKYFFQEL
jgi:radical SAM protein with 4Fe4S-binding SPASM domain